MFRTIALHWPLLGPSRRFEVCARLFWLLCRQVLWAVVTLWAAVIASSFALIPVGPLLQASRGAVAALLFVPMAMFGTVFFFVVRAGFRRIVRTYQEASRGLSVRLAVIATGHAMGGCGPSSAAVRTRLTLRLPLPRAPGVRPSVLVTALFVGAGCLGVLSSVASMCTLHVKCSSKQSEAKMVLKAIYVTELAWQGEKGTWLDLDGLIAQGGLDAHTVQGRYYAFHVERRANGFRATAVDSRTRVNRSATVPDVWTIDESTPRPEHVSNACD